MDKQIYGLVLEDKQLNLTDHYSQASLLTNHYGGSGSMGFIAYVCLQYGLPSVYSWDAAVFVYGVIALYLWKLKSSVD